MEITERIAMTNVCVCILAVCFGVALLYAIPITVKDGIAVLMEREDESND